MKKVYITYINIYINIYIYIYIYINISYIYNVFTRQSSVENCYQRTNYNIMVSNKNEVNPGGHPGLLHTCRTKPSCKNIQR